MCLLQVEVNSSQPLCKVVCSSDCLCWQLSTGLYLVLWCFSCTQGLKSVPSHFLNLCVCPVFTNVAQSSSGMGMVCPRRSVSKPWGIYFPEPFSNPQHCILHLTKQQAHISLRIPFAAAAPSSPPSHPLPVMFLQALCMWGIFALGAAQLEAGQDMICSLFVLGLGHNVILGCICPGIRA